MSKRKCTCKKWSKHRMCLKRAPKGCKPKSRKSRKGHKR